MRLVVAGHLKLSKRTSEHLYEEMKKDEYTDDEISVLLSHGRIRHIPYEIGEARLAGNESGYAVTIDKPHLEINVPEQGPNICGNLSGTNISYELMPDYNGIVGTKKQ